eukprot:629212-Amphidinium_carterae.1
MPRTTVDLHHVQPIDMCYSVILRGQDHAVRVTMNKIGMRSGPMNVRLRSIDMFLAGKDAIECLKRLRIATKLVEQIQANGLSRFGLVLLAMNRLVMGLPNKQPRSLHNINNRLIYFLVAKF